jgi:hypothetical protein
LRVCRHEPRYGDGVWRAGAARAGARATAERRLRGRVPRYLSVCPSVLRRSLVWLTHTSESFTRLLPRMPHLRSRQEFIPVCEWAHLHKVVTLAHVLEHAHMRVDGLNSV